MKVILSSIIFLTASTVVSSAVPIVPFNRLNLFLDSRSPFVSSDYTTGSTPSIPQVKFLRSNGNVEYYLSLNLPSVGVSSTGRRFILDTTTFAGMAHVRISDRSNGATGQCVDFVKAMINDTNLTSKWHASEKLANIPSSQLSSKLPPGTVIAYFGTSAKSGDTYSVLGQHTGMILTPVTKDSMGNPVGGNVLHQNFFVSPFNITVNGVSQGSAPQTITKNYLNWSDTSGIRSLGQYWTVDIY